MVSVPSWVPVVEVVMVALGLGSLGVIRWLDREQNWGRIRRSRLLLGIPWGTLVSLTGVLCVYLFIQGGWWNWSNPVTVAFRSWSYFYPTGMILAPFSHNGPGHLTGNLIGAVVLGSLAEYAWGHFPADRGASSFSSLWTNPYVRAFVLFPVGVFIVGIGTVVFGWGPIIGFSGVVFAFAGFSVLRYPIITVVALEARQVIDVVYSSLLNPLVVAQAESQFVRPWWAGIAVQGHLLGLVLGIILGVMVGKRRAIDATRVWIGVVLIGSSLTIWAVWWYGGGTEYIMYRGVGMVLVFALAVLVTLGSRAAWSAGSISGVPVRATGILVLLFPVIVMGFVAVPYNLSTVGDSGVPGDGPMVSVRDYDVTYAENVTDQHTSIVNLSVFGETTDVQRSGVVIVSESRHVWQQAVSSPLLAFEGRVNVRVGVVGWAETIGVKRAGWLVENANPVYMVWLRPPGESWRVAFLSSPAVAEPRIDGYRVRVDPDPSGFRLSVLAEDGVTVGQTPLPTSRESVRVRGLVFRLENDSVYALIDGTRVRIATKETYN